MNIKTMIAGFLAMLMMGGAAHAMDSEVLQEKMAEINEKAEESASEDRVAALEQQVEDLQELIHMMMEEDQAN
ncbi:MULTISPECIES: hypothetical protein [Halomonas]|uniref:Uncharacterized protein n=1 Tax=Halomonas halophila TaxID=29573 RepID=A0ABQ0U473_9GAMM|nr:MULTISPECIES: hypothetical protein [Halomonas]MDR5888909.1 hypothetical protein [Halomonas salina]WJY08084.1 hypothetical protein QWG60_04025 [Halomonas halophila]GEK73344.1 hypothetical protein HHA04nite_18880 [Halomonas halophila]